MGYIDIKVSIWQRMEIDDSEIEKFSKLSHSQKMNTWSELTGECEWLYNTWDFISTDQNNNDPTVKLYQGGAKPKSWHPGECVWTNKPLSILRDEKINEALDQQAD